MIDLLLATKNQTKTGELLSLGFNQVNRILYRATQRGLKRRTILNNVKNISIDEKSFKKGHNYVSVLSNPDTGAILNVTEGRKKEDLKKLLDSTFTTKAKVQIETVTTDMWEAYINTVKEELPQAHLCHDKFHLVKYLNHAVDIIRRQESKKWEALKNTKYLWLKDINHLTEKQRQTFDAINNTNHITAIAWKIKENFRAIAFKQPMNAAYVIFYRWCQNAIHSQLTPIIKVVEMFKRHTRGIINAMSLNKSNAMAERLNGKIQELKLSAKGYRTFENFKAAILFYYGKLNLYPQEKG